MKKAQIIIKSCNRRDLELAHVRNFLVGNGYALSEIEARQFLKLDEQSVNKDADLIILSTCGFTSVTEQSCLDDLALIERTKKPSAEVVVCGCLPEINPQKLAVNFHGKTFGPRSYEKLNEIVHADKKYEDFNHNNIALSYGPDTYTIQIHEGCPRTCSYCAIRLSIGKLKSTPMEQILAQFNLGLSEGYKKFVFLGDCAGGYGADIGLNFGQLLQAVIDLPGEFTLELTDLAPFYLPNCFNELKQLAAMGRLKSLYIATQSANPRVLGLMRRSHDMADAVVMLRELKKANPDIVLITSIIVGFPSETQAEMEDTIRYCKAIGFTHIYCHGYSARPDVDSTKLDGQHSHEEIKRRCDFVKEQLGKAIAVITMPGYGAVLTSSEQGH